MAEVHEIKLANGGGYLQSTLCDDDISFTILARNRAFNGQLDATKMAEIQTKMAGKFDNIPAMVKQAFTDPRKF